MTDAIRNALHDLFSDAHVRNVISTTAGEHLPHDAVARRSRGRPYTAASWSESSSGSQIGRAKYTATQEGN